MTPTIKLYSATFTDLHSVVGVIPKEGLAGPQPANPSFGMATTKIFRSVFLWHASCVRIDFYKQSENISQKYHYSIIISICQFSGTCHLVLGGGIWKHRCMKKVGRGAGFRFCRIFKNITGTVKDFFSETLGTFFFPEDCPNNFFFVFYHAPQWLIVGPWCRWHKLLFMEESKVKYPDSGIN